MSCLSLVLFSLLLLPTTLWAAVTLENPAPGSVKSGVGLVSGWVCEADRVEVRFDEGVRLFAPFGSDRPDTEGVCGDTENGFGLLLNYNELGNGPHTATLYVDDVIVTQVIFSVVTPGAAILRGVFGGGVVPLSNGTLVGIQWEEATQNFAITGYSHIANEHGLLFGHGVPSVPVGPFFPSDRRGEQVFEELNHLYTVLEDAAYGCRVYAEVDRRTYSQEEFLGDFDDDIILSYAVNSDQGLARLNTSPHSPRTVKKVRCVDGFALFWDTDTCESRSFFSEEETRRRLLTLEIFYAPYTDYDEDGSLIADNLPRWNVILHLPSVSFSYEYFYHIRRLEQIVIEQDRFRAVSSYYDREQEEDILFNVDLHFTPGAPDIITSVIAYNNRTGSRITLPADIVTPLTVFLQNVYRVVQGEDITPACPQ